MTHPTGSWAFCLLLNGWWHHWRHHGLQLLRSYIPCSSLSGTTSGPRTLFQHIVPLNSIFFFFGALLGYTRLSETHLLGYVLPPLFIYHSHAMLVSLGGLHLTRMPGSGLSPLESSMNLSQVSICLSNLLFLMFPLELACWGWRGRDTLRALPVSEFQLYLLWYRHISPHLLNFYLLLI